MSDDDVRSPTNEGNIRFWDDWNREWRFRSDHDAFMKRQAEAVREIATRHGLDGADILDVGCGTGWLANELVAYGPVMGTDLSPEAIHEGTMRFPAVNLVCGDFMQLDLAGPFDLVLSSDSLVPMPSFSRFIARIADLQLKGGVFVLMTQNPFVWSRRSTIGPANPSVLNWDVAEWPGRRTLVRLLTPFYDDLDIRTIVPGGARGLLFWVENRYVQGFFGRAFGQARWLKLLERAGVGRELIIVGRRR